MLDAIAASAVAGLSETSKAVLATFACRTAGVVSVGLMYADALAEGGMQAVREVHTCLVALNPRLHTIAAQTLAKMEALHPTPPTPASLPATVPMAATPPAAPPEPPKAA